MNHNTNSPITHYISPENVENIRERFEGVIDHFKYTLSKVSELIDIPAPTLCKFIRDRQEITFVQLIRIEDFVIDMERNVKESFK